MLLHHFVLFNPAQTGIGCPISEPFFGAGNERTHLHLPTPYGYENTSANWNMITHLVNTSNVARTVNVEIIFRHRPLSATEPARPAWLDIDSICAGGDSEYTIPVGYSDTHVDWTVPQNARIIGMSGHLHDIDIIDPSPCPVHCSSRGEAIALSAELLGGDGNDYFGPIPPNNAPPADITGATLCRSEAYHGTAFGTAIGANGHMDTMGHCGIFSHLPAGAQAEAYPAAGAYSFEGYPIKQGQVIRLHSEYQNNSGAPKTDVMGIMGPWLAFPDPGYPRPKGATPMRASLVPAYNQCTSPNRVHGPPDLPGGTNPDGSCNPPTQTSGQITVGSPDADGGAANSVGFGEAVGDQRQRGHHRRRGRRALSGVDQRRALQARRGGLRGGQRRRRGRLLGPGAATDRPADHRPLQRPIEVGVGRTPRSRHGALHGASAARRSAPPARSTRPPTR